MEKYIKPAVMVVTIEATSQLLTTSTLGISDDGVDIESMKSPQFNNLLDDENP